MLYYRSKFMSERDRPIPIPVLEAKLTQLQEADHVLEERYQKAAVLPEPDLIPTNSITQPLSEVLQRAYQRAQKTVSAVLLGRERLQRNIGSLSTLIQTEAALPQIRQ